jgi:hypothetical protein
MDLPEGGKLTGDKACYDYDVEDVINQAGISFIPLRKKNSKRLSLFLLAPSTTW